MTNERIPNGTKVIVDTLNGPERGIVASSTNPTWMNDPTIYTIYFEDGTNFSFGEDLVRVDTEPRACCCGAGLIWTSRPAGAVGPGGEHLYYCGAGGEPLTRA